MGGIIGIFAWVVLAGYICIYPANTCDFGGFRKGQNIASHRSNTKSNMGTGLGLFISKSIVEARGGRIWAENYTDRKGATFGFSLPLLVKELKLQSPCYHSSNNNNRNCI
jgi:hypothetical protein